MPKLLWTQRQDIGLQGALVAPWRSIPHAGRRSCLAVTNPDRGTWEWDGQ